MTQQRWLMLLIMKAASWGSVFQEHSQAFTEQRLDIRRMLAAMPDDLRQTYQALSKKTAFPRLPFSWAYPHDYV